MRSNVTLGIDLAGTTGICEINWVTGTSTVEVGSFSTGELVERATAVIEGGGWVAIDSPFGFPKAFHDAVSSLEKHCPPIAHVASFAWRRTDERVRAWQSALREETGGDWKVDLLSSVSHGLTRSVLIAQHILGEATGEWPPDRIGLDGGRVVEAYPIAALRYWLRTTSEREDLSTYKAGRGHGAKAGRRIYDRLCEESGMVDAELEGRIADSRVDDAVDAFVCALVARMVSQEKDATGPKAAGMGYSEDDLAVISTEGWMHLPPDGHQLRTLRDGQSAS